MQKKPSLLERNLTEKEQAIAIVIGIIVVGGLLTLIGHDPEEETPALASGLSGERANVEPEERGPSRYEVAQDIYAIDHGRFTIREINETLQIIHGEFPNISFEELGSQAVRARQICQEANGWTPPVYAPLLFTRRVIETFVADGRRDLIPSTPPSDAMFSWFSMGCPAR